MTLATVDLLARIVAARTARFSRLHRLAVDHPGRWTRHTSCQFTCLPYQHVVDVLPGAVVAPAVEVVLHRGERRKVLGQHAPLATTLGDIENRLDHPTQRGLTRPPAPVRRWQQWCNHRPLLLGRVTCIPQPFPLILRASDFSPG